MKKFKVIILTLFLFSLSVFFITQLGLTQDTWSERMEERRERFREKIREKWIEKKREELTKEKEGDGGQDVEKGVLLKAKYENKEYGFSINYPAEYIEKETRALWGKGEVFRAVSPNKVPQLSVQILYMDDGVPFSEMKDAYLNNQMMLGLTNTKITSEKKITLPDGAAAYELEIESRVKGIDIKSLNIWAQKYDRWFIVEALTTRGGWRSHLSEMKAILASLTAPTRDDPNAVHYNSFKVNVPMRDGKTLSALVVLPGEKDPYPIIFWYTNYGARISQQLLMKTGDDDLLFGPDGRAKYGFVIAVTRGRYENKNAAHKGSPTLGEDGVTFFEWIDKQPWSDKIGIWSWGADGAASYDTIAKKPKGLTAAVIQSGPYLNVAPYPDDYTRYYPGGVLGEANMRYFDLQWPGSWNAIIPHPQWDKWYDDNVTAKKPKAEDINIPIQIDNGWFTYNVNYLLRNYEDLKDKSKFGAKTKTVIGPWSQNYFGVLGQGDLQYPKAVNSDKAHDRRFLDYWLRGIDNGLYNEPPIYYYQMGEEVWKSALTWPPQDTKDTKYYLHDSNKLLTTAPAGKSNGFKQYTFDPKDPSPGIGGRYVWFSNFFPNPVIGPAYLENHEKKVLTGRSDYIIYDTPILSEDLEIAGNPSAKLYIQSNTPDTDIIIRLVDFDPNAPKEKQNLLVEITPQRMRYRNGLKENPVWMEPEEIYEVEIKMEPIAYTWKKGHQVRLIVSSSAYPLYAINPNNKNHFMWDKGKPLVAEVKLWSNSDYPSYLVMPSSNRSATPVIPRLDRGIQTGFRLPPE